jgi:hypothetical protein
VFNKVLKKLTIFEKQEAVIEKIRLKNSTLKVHKNKLILQLKQKEEMGEVLHAIDFDQLQIENKQYLIKIEERNAELMKLKVSAGNTIQTLNFHRVLFFMEFVVHWTYLTPKMTETIAKAYGRIESFTIRHS